MAASTGDKITDTRNAARPNSARVSSGRSGGGTTLACDNLAGWPTASKVHFVTYTIDSSSNPVAGTQLDCYGIVSGNNIGSLVVVDGTDTGNSVNDVVEMLPTAAWGQDLSDALLVGHTRAGAHVSGLPLTSPVLTTPVISSISNTGTLTLPTSTDTLVGKATTDTLTNKTITATSNSVSSAILTNPYKFRAYQSSAQAITAGVATKVSLQTENFDTGSNFDSVTNYRFTAPVAGFYFFTARSQMNQGTQTQALSMLYKNGTETVRGMQVTGVSGFIGSMVSDLMQLAANDYVEYWIFVNSTNANLVALSTETYLSGFLVSIT